MKGLGTPPEMVMVTSKIILTLMGEKINPNDAIDKIWKKAVQIMNNPDKFLAAVKGFDGEKIDQTALDNTFKIIRDPLYIHEYTVENMKTKN